MPRPKTGRAKHDPISLQTRIEEYKATQEKIRIKQTKQRIQEIRRLVCNYFGRGIYASLNLVDICRPADGDPIDRNYNGLSRSESITGQRLAQSGGVGTTLKNFLITFQLEEAEKGDPPKLVVCVYNTIPSMWVRAWIWKLSFDDGLSNQERIHKFVKLLAEAL